MKNIFITIMLVCLTNSVFGQKKADVNLIEADSTWGKEIIEVPFWFAPEIDYKGYEDIRFAKGWEKIESDGFWVLAFAWDINLKEKPAISFFEESLKFYFDGLMKVVNEDETLEIPKTKASFKVKKTDNDSLMYKGTLETYDAFTTKKVILLNVIIKVYYCEAKEEFIPLFKMSPKDYEHESWKMLKQAKIGSNICE